MRKNKKIYSLIGILVIISFIIIVNFIFQKKGYIDSSHGDVVDPENNCSWVQSDLNTQATSCNATSQPSNPSAGNTYVSCVSNSSYKYVQAKCNGSTFDSGVVAAANVNNWCSGNQYSCISNGGTYTCPSGTVYYKRTYKYVCNACYVNNETHDYRWDTSSPGTGYVKDDSITSESACIYQIPEKKCYQNSDGTVYKWQEENPGTGWTEVADKTEATCKACFVNNNTNEYAWSTEAPNNSYTKSNITSESSCVASNVCFVNSATNDYKWQTVSPGSGYVISDTILSENDCQTTTVEPEDNCSWVQSNLNTQATSCNATNQPSNPSAGNTYVSCVSNSNYTYVQARCNGTTFASAVVSSSNANNWCNGSQSSNPTCTNYTCTKGTVYYKRTYKYTCNACYVNNETHDYRWDTSSPGTGYVKDDSITSESACIYQIPEKKCYQNSDGTVYKWQEENPGTGWTEVADKTEATCKACFVNNNTNEYAWSTEAPNNSYTKSNITSESSCVASNVCFVNSATNDYKWQTVSPGSGYVISDTIVDEESCSSKYCYVNKATNDYIWSKTSPGNNYIIENDITLESSCVAGKVCFVNSATNDYKWQIVSPGSGYAIDNTKNNENSCVASKVCFVNNNETEYKWQTISPGTGWSIINNKTENTCKACFVNNSTNEYTWDVKAPNNNYVKSNITTESSCVASKVCFVNSNETEYKWQTISPGTDWSIINNKTENTCKACFVNNSTNEYIWDVKAPNNNYVKSTTIANEDSCTGDSVCFVNSDATEYKWQKQSPGAGWSILNDKVQSTCKACFVNNSTNEYTWNVKAPNNNYVKSNITTESSCVANKVCFVNSDETEYSWSFIKPAGTWNIVPNKDENSCNTCFINYKTGLSLWNNTSPGDDYEKVNLEENSCSCKKITITKKDKLTNTSLNDAILNISYYGNMDVGTEDVNICPLKKYSLTEVKRPTGYLLSDEKIDIELNNNQLYVNNKIEEDLVINYYNNSNSIIIRVIDEEGNNISDAIVGIYKDNEEIKRIITTETDTKIEKLDPGQYLVKEILPPEKYVIDDNEYSFEVKEDGTIDKELITITNYLMPEVRIHNLNRETNTYIEGAIFAIKDEENNVIKTFTTTNSSYNIYLPYGNYILEEIETPISYIKNNEKILFTLDATTDKQYDIKVYNEPYYMVKLIKYSYDGIPLEGAVFELFDSENNKIREITSTNDYVLIDQLPKGTYSLKEIKAPEGYALSDSIVNFDIDYTKDITEIFVYDAAIVPMTSKFSNYYVLITIFFTLGFALIYFVKMNKRIPFEEPVLIKKKK